MSEFFYRDSGEVVGPISGATLKSMCRRGEISPRTEVRKDDGPWAPAGEVKGLAELFTLETARVVMVSRRSPTSRESKGEPSSFDAAKRPSLAPPLPGEFILLRGRPHFFRGLPFFSTKTSATVLVFLTGAAIYQPLPSTLVLLAGIAVVPSLWLTFAYFCVRGMHYEVTSERTLFVSRPMKRLDFIIRHAEVEKIWIKRGMLQRLFGTGDLYLRVKGDGDSHFIPNLSNPTSIVEEIDKRKGS